MFGVMGKRPSLVRASDEGLVVLGDRSRDTTRAESHRGRREMSASVDCRSRRDVIMSQARPWERRASSKAKGRNAVERELESAGRWTVHSVVVGTMVGAV